MRGRRRIAALGFPVGLALAVVATAARGPSEEERAAEAPAAAVAAPTDSARPRAQAWWGSSAGTAAPDEAPVRPIEGVPMIAVGDLGRLLDGTKLWRADVRQLTLRARGHRLVFTAGLPYVVIDARTVRLPAAVRSLRGELYVPVALVAELPDDGEGRPLVHHARGRVVRAPALGGSAERVAFAPEPPAGPKRVRLVALDPGHGGEDQGVTVSGLAEKTLTLRLARLIQAELSRRSIGAVLLREDDRAASAEERAERANRSHADLLIALHFDGVLGTAARGATVYGPPPEPIAAPASDRRGPIQVLPWRDVGMRHASRSRELGERLLAALDRAAQGPTRFREIQPCALLGVNLPGVLLECATLTSTEDRARLQAPGGLERLAAAIADGILAYRDAP